MRNKNQNKGFLRLSPRVALKRLEDRFVYQIGTDELYEIGEEAETFLSKCDGTVNVGDFSSESEFIEYCLEEGILEILPKPNHINVFIEHAPKPSLRYLELQLLKRCNLKCLHCYQSHSHTDELSLEDALKITYEFASIGGLRLLISGGEPLLYPYLQDFITETSKLKIRKILLTNGTMINKENISWLKVDNIQISLDGWQKSHDFIRGNGSFDKTLQGIELAKNSGIPISIATMVHSENVNDFEQLKSFIEHLEATEWGIDLPCIAGSLKDNTDLISSYKEFIHLKKYAYGGSYHGSSSGFACGRHLMTVLPSGLAVKCGFFEDKPLGDACKSLLDCWMNLEHIPLDKLECKGCSVIEDCAGGCRFRATSPLAPDPVMCAYYGV